MKCHLRNPTHFKEVASVIYSHKWNNVEEWASNINKLADLTDAELNTLKRFARRQRSRDAVARASLRQRSPLVTVLDSLGEWQERMRQRRQLMMLDARALADIAISRADAEAEYGKMPWRL